MTVNPHQHLLVLPEAYCSRGKAGRRPFGRASRSRVARWGASRGAGDEVNRY